MFPSSGLFANINCPFSKRGFCERPHCLYKHDTELRDMLVAAGIQNGCPDAGCGATVNDEAQDGCIQELERINKEIETVRHEVEQEKRRLSHYQTVQADGRNTAPNISVSKSETSGKHVDKGSAYTNSKTKTYSRARKYVVDNSKPRTDLEYDPLSNFSADLRSYNSSVKDQKGKHGHVLKRVKNAAPCDQKKPLAYQPHLSRLASPLHESNDDGDLIIDLPPSPDTKRRQGEDFVAGKSLRDKDEELKVLNTALDSPPLCLANKERVNTNCRAENSQGLFNLNENNEYENKSVDESVFDLAGCLQNGRKLKIAPFQATELLLQKSPEPASPSATTDRQDQTWNNPSKENTFQVELPRCELPLSVENMNPLQPYNIPQSNSLFYKAANLDSPCRQKTTEQLAQDNYWSSTKCVPSVLPHSQKMSSKIPEKMQTEAALNHAPTEIYLEPAEPAGSGQAWHNLSASSLTNRPETSSRSTEQPLNAHNVVILIESSSEEENELNCSEMEVSDSDTMEECYRIFMEANNEEKGTEEPADVPVGSMEDVEKPEFKVKPKALLGKKRVAHEAKHAEQPVAKSRPQPQVLVPLRGPGPAVSGFASQPSKILHVQQRASLLSASVKAGQVFVSSASQRMPDTQNAPSPLTPPPENLQPALVENAYMNYISLGTAVIGVGNNLHFILPEGTFPLPVTSSSSQVTSVLTPISPMQFAVKQSYNAPAVATWQRYRQTAPVLIPALARKPAQTSAFATANSSPATAPQAAVKPMPNKRKLKQKCEVAKVPHDVRQRYVNMFTEEFLKTTANVNDAFEKAIAEEKTVYNRSVNKLKYLSVAVNALKRLKNQSAPAAKGADENTVKTPKMKGNIPLNLMNLKGNDDTALYEIFQDYVLTEERLIESNYPVQHPEKPGGAILFTDKKVNADPLKRNCCRCGATYSVNKTGKHVRKEECNYHYGKGVKNKVPGGVETRYSCCEGVMGAPGCQVFKLHVHDSLSLDGFVSTVPRHSSDSSCPGVYSLNCEMIYTIHGLELCRVTVVNCSLQVVYDTFVKPDNEVIDYNTRFSGISEEDVKGNCTSLREVQGSLLSFISADTILIGYGLETDLCALKLLHGTVVDTSVVFPHRLGPPHKLTLNNLTAEYLTRIIQESVCGHDTAEDAAACMELMLWKAKENGKLKK